MNLFCFWARNRHLKNLELRLMADLNTNLARLGVSVAALTDAVSKLPPRVDESVAAQAVSDAADKVDAANATLTAYEAN